MDKYIDVIIRIIPEIYNNKTTYIPIIKDMNGKELFRGDIFDDQLEAFKNAMHRLTIIELPISL